MRFIEFTKKRSLVLIGLVAGGGLLGACRHKESFPSIGLNVAGPVDVAVADDGQHFYVLNSDPDRTYNMGSLLVLDKNGSKLSSVEVPRMGRTLTVAGNDLLLTTDWQDINSGDQPRALLFDISTPDKPVLKLTLSLDCTPINAVMRKGYDHFAISCDGPASLYIGTLAADRSQSQLKKVRTWGVPRRALHLDPQRQLLLAFTTELSKQQYGDDERLDFTSYDLHAKEIQYPDGKPRANEIPDEWEQTPRAQANVSSRQLYQFIVYDLAAERQQAPGCLVKDSEDCNFPYRDANTDLVAQSEVRWAYFKLNNFDGAPDLSSHFNDPTYKFYRTNFFAAHPDPTDANAFYLSHRGTPDKSRFANQVLRVSIKADPRSTLQRDASGAITGFTHALTSEAFNFERAYGFKGPEATKYVYPGEFSLGQVNGQQLIVVNNFRDLVNWAKDDRYFSLGVQSLVSGNDGPRWFSELVGDTTPTNLETFNQIALTTSGRAMSCSFYGNAVMVLDITPGVGISKINRIE